MGFSWGKVKMCFLFNPNIAPESGIFPERFLPRLFERTKVDVIHRLAVRSGKLGEKIPGKTG